MRGLYAGFTNLFFFLVSAGLATIKLMEFRALILQIDLNQATHYYTPSEWSSGSLLVASPDQT